MSETKINSYGSQAVNFNTVTSTENADTKTNVEQTLPKAAEGNQGNTVSGGPVLQAPNPEAIDQLKNKSGEALMALINEEMRKTDLVNSKESLSAIADQKKHKREEIGKKLNEQIEKQEEESKKSFWSKLFGGIAQALGVIASVVAIAVGTVTGCPLLIAAGVAGALFAIDSFAQQTFGDGALSKFLSLFMDEDKARLVAGIVDAVGAVACGIAGGIGSGVGINLMVAAGSKIGVACKVINIAANTLSAVSNIGKGTAMVMTAFTAKDIEDIRADKKRQEAVMAQLNFNQQLTQEHLKSMLEMHNKITEGVKEAIDSTNQTNSAILTNGAEAPA